MIRTAAQCEYECTSQPEGTTLYYQVCTTAVVGRVRQKGKPGMLLRACSIEPRTERPGRWGARKRVPPKGEALSQHTRGRKGLQWSWSSEFVTKMPFYSCNGRGCRCQLIILGASKKCSPYLCIRISPRNPPTKKQKMRSFLLLPRVQKVQRVTFVCESSLMGRYC